MRIDPRHVSPEPVNADLRDCPDLSAGKTHAAVPDLLASVVGGGLAVGDNRVADCPVFIEVLLARSVLTSRASTFPRAPVHGRPDARSFGPSRNLPHRNVNAVPGPMFRRSYPSGTTGLAAPAGDAWQGCHALVRLRTFATLVRGNNKPIKWFGLRAGREFSRHVSRLGTKRRTLAPARSRSPNHRLQDDRP